jgi:hypothetical protein
MNEVFEPVRIGRAQPEEPAKVHVFTLDDRKYHMPAQVPAGLALTVMELSVERGEAAAVIHTLRTVLGENGYQALKDPRVSLEDFRKISEIVRRHVMGAVEEQGKG